MSVAAQSGPDRSLERNHTCRRSMTNAVAWAQRLSDRRGKEVIFLSHCLLNENTRYVGGACERGASLSVVQACLARGYGIVQMPCPEQHAWGGVLKRHLLRFFGSRGTLLVQTQGIALPALLWYTRRIYRRLAKQVADHAADYVNSGFRVVGIVAVDGSPSCGLTQTTDVRKALGLVATLSPASKAEDLTAMILSSSVPGRGMFVKALQDEVSRRGLKIPFLAFDLASELQGRPSGLDLGAA